MPSDWGKRPTKKAPAAPGSTSSNALDQFVHPGKPVTKRLNADIPIELHRRVKAGCSREGREMTTVIIELLEQRFPE
jgi:hypothetical protein